MATSIQNLPYDTSTDANYRAIVAGIIAGITGVGWVQTSDSGQENPVSATRPSGFVNVPQYTGGKYLMFRSNDGGAPINLRVSIGTVNSGNGIAVGFAIGTGTNGAGVLTGNVTSIVGSANFNYATQPNGLGGVTLPCYFSGDGSRLTIFLWQRNVIEVLSFFCNIERRRDASGAPTTAGWTIHTGQGAKSANGAAGGAQQVLPVGTAAIPAPQSRWWYLLPDANTANDNAGNLAYGAVIPMSVYAENPVIGLMCYGLTDVGFDTQESLPLYGQSRNYRAMGPGISGMHVGLNTGATSFHGIWMLWE